MPTTDCLPQGGTRIEAISRAHDDGSTGFLYHVDSELGERCTPGLALDGSSRCMPVVDGDPFVLGKLVYSDSSCTVRAAEVSSAVNPSADMPWMVQSVAVGCESRTHVYALGNQIAADLSVYAKSTAGECTEIVRNGNPYFLVSKELQPDEFVELTGSWIGEGRLDMHQYEGADGSRICDPGVGYLDSEILGHEGEPQRCANAFAVDQKVRCLPLSLSTAAVYSDNACTTQEAVARVGGACPIDSTYVLESTGVCSRRRVRAVGSAADDLYITEGDTCVPYEPPAEQTTSLISSEISPTSFALSSRVYVDNGTRLRAATLEQGGLVIHQPTLWLDSEFMFPCSFVTAADGKVRCLPRSRTPEAQTATVSSFFVDEACTTGLSVGVADISCSDGPPAYAHQATATGLKIFPITGPLEVSALYQGAEGACTPVANPSQHWALGAEMPPEMFVAVMESAE